MKTPSLVIKAKEDAAGADDVRNPCCVWVWACDWAPAVARHCHKVAMHTESEARKYLQRPFQKSSGGASWAASVCTTLQYSMRENRGKKTIISSRAVPACQFPWKVEGVKGWGAALVNIMCRHS